MAISERDLQPSRIDEQHTAVSITAAAAPGKPLIVGLVASERLVEAGIVLPERVEYRLGQADEVEWS